MAEAIRYVREVKADVVRPDLLGLAISEGALWTIRRGWIHGHNDCWRRYWKAHYSDVIGLMQAMYINNVSVAEMCDGPIRYAMSAIGGVWPQDKRSIFIEHRATILCVRALCQIRLSLPEVSENAPTAMGATPQDDPYLLPSLMASLVLHECGFEEVNLGPNTPVDVLADSAEDEQPDVVWIAISNPLRSRTHHREIENLACVVDSYGGLFLVGGRNAATYTGPKAQHCQSMSEINTRVAEISGVGSDDES